MTKPKPKDGVARVTAVRRFPRDHPQGRFGARYRPRAGGIGHMLDTKETKALMLEQLADYTKQGFSSKVQVANIIATEMHDPPEEVERRMLNAVALKHRTPYMMVNFRVMLREYMQAQWGVNLTNGSGDC